MSRVFISDKDFLTKGLIPNRKNLGEEFYNKLDYFNKKDGGQYPDNYQFLNPEGPYKSKAIHTLQRLGNYISTDAKLLDIGCGPCHIDYWNQKLKMGFEIYNTDISGALISKIKSDGRKIENIDICDILNQTPFPGVFFDALIFSDILEHFNPIDSFLLVKRLISTSLKENGIVYINIPNRESWSNKSYYSRGHVWLPNICEVRSFYSKLGLTTKLLLTTRGFPGSNLYNHLFHQDLLLPLFGRSIIAIYRK